MPHLPQLVTGLLEQTYSNLEIVFSEGGGTDESLDFLKSLTDNRIRIIETPQRISAAENWTRASQAAAGEFTKLICQDDLLYAQAIEQQLEDFELNPSAVMAIAKRDIVDARGSVIFQGRGLTGIKDHLVPGPKVIHQCYLQGTNVIGEPLAVLFKTDVLQTSLPWIDSNPLMLDLSMYEKVAQEGQVVTRLNSVGAFRVSNASWSTRLAKTQVDQTRQWQREYEDQHRDLPKIDRVRATAGRHLQTNLRRAAYAFLNARGRLAN